MSEFLTSHQQFWSYGHGLESHPTDWRIWGLNLRLLGTRQVVYVVGPDSDSLAIIKGARLGLAKLSNEDYMENLYHSDLFHSKINFKIEPYRSRNMKY